MTEELTETSDVRAPRIDGPASIDPATRIGSIHLDVADLARSRAYYEQRVGLLPVREEPRTIALGPGADPDARELIVLREQPGASPSRGYCGLYHFALLLGERRDLASWVAHAAETRIPLVGLSDHFVSEAVYLTDPDGHGIEIYWDRPRALWEGQVAQRMTTLPLDVGGLLDERDVERRFEGLPASTTVGHVHLRVAEIPRTVGFYRDILGFELTASLAGSAAFFGAGGYHHHVGANTWESAGNTQPPRGTATLTRATILLPDSSELERVRERALVARIETVQLADGVLIHDPSGNPLLLTAAPEA
jgi:catechol 2,3-dioxygenase